MGGDIAYVELSGASSRATLGLYAGIKPQELELLVRTALKHFEDVCVGFQVTQETSTLRNGRKKRNASSIPSLVPLSVACIAPELLIGQVFALFKPSMTSQSSLEAQNEVFTTLNDVERLQKLLQSLESEQKLSSYELAKLRHLCEQQKTQVLTMMSGNSSVDEKKDFLLKMLHSKDSEELQTSKTKPIQAKKTLYTESIAKKVATIGGKISSPQIQMKVFTLADIIRQSLTEANDSRFDNDAMKLLTIVENLLDKHMLSEEHGLHILEFVLGEKMQNCSNEEDSVINLESKRLAAFGCEAPKPIASKNKGKCPRKGTKQGSSLAKKRVRNALAVAAAPAVAIVTLLHDQHLLTSLELDIIKALIEQEDSQVLQTLRVFKQSDHRDVGALRDALVSIVEEITMELGDEEKAAAAFARGLDDAVREEDQLEDSDEDSGSLGWQRHLIFLLEQWQTQQQLTPADASTLRKMVTERHNLLESAYEVFAGDGDASELLDTLQRVAKLQRQIEQCQAGQNGLNVASASDLSLEDVVREMQRRGVLQSGDAAGLLVLFHGENEALQAANEAFQADGDVNELEDTLLLVVKHARFGREENQSVDEVQAVCRLLADFGRSERLELWQIQLLVSLLKCRDPRLLAAADVYYEDQDTNELVETLEILVELAAWERHRRAMVHDWIPPLARNGKLSRDGAERLVEMVNARDDRVVAALVVFLSDNNKEEFVDTLARIASLETIKLSETEVDELKEGHLVLALLKELEDKSVISGEEREKVEELLYSAEPRMLAAMDVLAATHDAEDFADTARRVLAKVKDKVKDKDAGEKRELEEDEPSSEAAVGSPGADLAANKQNSGEILDDDAKYGESNAQVPEKSNEHTSAEGEVQEERGPNELAEQQKTDELEQKEELQEKDVEDDEKGSVASEDEGVNPDVKTDIVVDVNDEV